MDELDMKIKAACEQISQELIDEIDWDPETVDFSPEYRQKMKELFPFFNEDKRQKQNMFTVGRSCGKLDALVKGSD